MSVMREISATELVAKYLKGAPSEVFDFVRVMPNGERVLIKIRVQLQRAEDNIDALVEAQGTAKTKKETADYGDIYKEAQAHELLARALRATEEHPLPDGTKHYPPLFVGAAHLRTAFTESELAVLLNCYHIVKAKYGPLEFLEKEDAETWIARLSDPLRGPFFLSQLDSLHWPGLLFLIATVARDLYASAGLELPTLDVSSESPSEESTPDTGSSGAPPVVSSTQDPELKVPTGRLMTAEEAAALVKDRQKT